MRILQLLNLLFGCRHDWGWPHSRRDALGTVTGHYQCCVRCGEERDYLPPWVRARKPVVMQQAKSIGGGTWWTRPESGGPSCQV